MLVANVRASATNRGRNAKSSTQHEREKCLPRGWNAWLSSGQVISIVRIIWARAIERTSRPFTFFTSSRTYRKRTRDEKNSSNLMNKFITEPAYDYHYYYYYYHCASCCCCYCYSKKTLEERKHVTGWPEAQRVKQQQRVELIALTGLRPVSIYQMKKCVRSNLRESEPLDALTQRRQTNSTFTSFLRSIENSGHIAVENSPAWLGALGNLCNYRLATRVYPIRCIHYIYIFLYTSFERLRERATECFSTHCTEQSGYLGLSM